MQNLSNRGVWVRVGRKVGEPIQGWLIGEIPQGLLIALDEELKDVRVVSGYTGDKLKRGEAVSLLREAERDLFSPDGCGISWRNPPRKEAGPAAGHYELVYPGDVCNCQGRLTYQSGGLVALGFRSACSSNAA